MLITIGRWATSRGLYRINESNMNSHPPVKLHYTSAYQFYRFGEAKTPEVRAKFLQMYRKIIEERLPSDLDVTISDIQFKTDDRVYIELQGKRKSDVQFTMSILKELTGQTFESHNVPKRAPTMGYMRKVGKVGFGLFVDIGVENPYKEALIPLHTLRRQLTNEEKIPLSEIIKKYGFMDNLPIQVEITEIADPHSRTPKYEAKIHEDYLKRMAEWVDWGLDIIFTVGEARQMVKRTIAKRGHTIDVQEIQRLGPLETAVICNQGTTGPGIIAHIGKYLSHCRMSTMRTMLLTPYWQAKTEAAKEEKK